MIDFIQNLDVVALTKWAGYVGLTAIIFCETGLFLGFFLPGDSLLFAAGLLASQGMFNMPLLMGLLIIAAIAGYTLAYWIGSKFGHWLLKREDSIWFKKRYLIQAHEFYEKHGGKALILGRLLPIIRTFLPIVAGMASMTYRRYSFFNVIGALIWCGGLTLLGFFLGNVIPNPDTYILPLILLIIFLSILPGLIQLLRMHCKSRRRKTDASV